jgi:putative endonuclease
MRGQDRRRTGRRGELVALVLLSLKGYRLRHRNWRGPTGELDLVFDRRKEVVFVEVKARSGEMFGGAVAAVDRDKQNAMVRTAASYLSRHGLWQRPARFDVVTVERCSGFPGWRVRHLKHVIRPDLGRLM